MTPAKSQTSSDAWRDFVGGCWQNHIGGGMGDDGHTLVTKSNYLMLNTFYTLGPAPEPNGAIVWSTRLPAPFKRYAAKVSVDTT